MKRLLVFILILVSSYSENADACGWSPYGEDLRYRLITPDLYPYLGYGRLYYNSEVFSYGNEDQVSGDQSINVALWRKRCQNIPSEESVWEAIYGEDKERLNNDFIKYLTKQKDKEALDYIHFAHNCSFFNQEISDPWERNDSIAFPKRDYLIKAALSRSKQCKDQEIKKRYVFLAIRLAYYNHSPRRVEEIYKTEYEKVITRDTEKDIIDYWAMYFMSCVSQDEAYSNYLAAQVFVHAPEKRFMLTQFYFFSVPVEEVLAFAKTSEEKAAIWTMTAIHNPGRTLDAIRKIYALDPASEALSFLILREVNKLEDWIYTPYYMAFMPTVVSEEWRSTRIAEDRAYAGQILTFMRTVNKKKVSRPEVWDMANAYLFLMTQNYAKGIEAVNTAKSKAYLTVPQRNFLLSLKTICLTAQQSMGTAVIPAEMNTFIHQQDTSGNNRFLFAVGRELEFKGNTTDAALLYAHVNEMTVDEWNYYTAVYWNGKTADNNSSTRKSNEYYADYFSYLDAYYTPAQIQILISKLNTAKAKDDFATWYYKPMQSALPRLYDLLGTKYIRQNNLDAALEAFKKVNDTLWKKEPYVTYLNANPFYNNAYNEHTPTGADSIRFTKVTLTQTLIQYLRLAEDPNNKDRDYYYFLVANCYLNMTEYGNSWLMRHYRWSTNISYWPNRREDDQEFYTCRYAEQYYLKAKSVTQSKTFAALCLRMAGRCEKHRLYYEVSLGESYDNDIAEKVFQANRHYNQLKKQYPEDYETLISNCESVDEYFLARRAIVIARRKNVVL